MLTISTLRRFISIDNCKFLKGTICTMDDVNSLKRKIDGEEVEDVELKRLKNEVMTETEIAPKIRIKYHKYAMLLSYCGLGYCGMQINLQVPTIEGEILSALRKINLIDDSDVVKPGQKINFQRAARTDKSVSAVKQICSVKLPRDEDDKLKTCHVESINNDLPKTIRLWGFVHATQGFDAKRACDNRSYSYSCPSFAFAGPNDPTADTFRMTKERLEEVNKLLLVFKGTHNFYNFTSNRKPEDKSCKRYIINFECGQPFIRDDLEFVTLKVRGQSFMLHQIRKMIGVVISVIRGYVDKSYIEKSFLPTERQDIPKAPGLGLVLEEVHFDSYNKRYAATHDKLSWEKYQSELDKFREDYIDSVIVKTEKTEKSMLEWLESLTNHTFDGSSNESNECLLPLAEELPPSQQETRNIEKNILSLNEPVV